MLKYTSLRRNKTFDSMLNKEFEKLEISKCNHENLETLFNSLD